MRIMSPIAAPTLDRVSAGQDRRISRFMMPLYFGEVPIILWLLIMGAKVPQSQAPSSHVG